MFVETLLFFIDILDVIQTTGGRKDLGYINVDASEILRYALNDNNNRIFLLVENLESDEEGTGLCRSVEVTRVAEGTFIQVFLECIEDVVYPTVELQLHVATQYKGVVELGIEVEEIRCMHHFVLGDVRVWEVGRNLTR